MEYSGKRYPEDSWVLHWGFEFITFIPFYKNHELWLYQTIMY